MKMKTFKFLGDDYLATMDLFESIPEKIKDELRFHGIIKFRSAEQAHYFYHSNYERYRALLENVILYEFIGKYPEYEEIIAKNKGIDLKIFKKKEESSDLYR